MNNLDFYASRTVRDFYSDCTNYFQILKGPLNCGKTSACLMRIWMITMNQEPSNDGVRYARWGVIRDTAVNLQRSTIKTWEGWYPPDKFGEVKGKPPYYHFKNDKIDLEVLFFNLATPDHIKNVKSTDFTGVYFNECQYVNDPLIFSELRGRTARYPSKRMGGGIGRFLIIADCNPPSTSHWIYHYVERQKRDRWKIYHFPPAIIKAEGELNLKREEFALDATGKKWINNPDADYRNLTSDPDWWLRSAEGEDPERIKILLCGEYGVMSEGTPVHPQFNDNIHYSSVKLAANPNLPICLGWDFGNTPACAVIQMQSDGRIFVLDEFPTEHDFLRIFATDTVLPALDRKYPWWRQNHISVHDPAGLGATGDGKTAADILRELDVESIPAFSNSLEFRRDALKFYLSKLINGSPSIVFSSNCHVIREGLMGHFQYEILPSTKLDQVPTLKETPKKNFYSHICEALEYAVSYYAPGKKKEDNSPAKIANFLARDRVSKDFRNKKWRGPRRGL